MSSPGSSLLKVEIVGRTERRLAWLALVAVPVGVMTVALTASSPVALAWYVLSATVAAALATAALWRNGAFGGPRRLQSIALLADGSWSLTDARGTHRMRLLAGSRAGYGWLWLQWAPLSSSLGLPGRSLLLTRADVSAAGMRRLQLYLRWQGPAERLLRNRRGAFAATSEV